MTTITDNAGHSIEFDAAVQLMDDELREAVHSDIAPCSEQDFYNEYCRRHSEKYGVDFNAV